MWKLLWKLLTEIANLEIHDKLDKTLNRDPNHNYEIFSTLLQTAKSKHIPKRIKKFNSVDIKSKVDDI